MQIPNLTLAAKLGAGAIGGLAVIGAGTALGLHLGSASASTATAAPIVASSPPPHASPSPGQGNKAARVVRTALLQAEAQALGITVKQLAADLKQGTTVQQLATQKGLTEAQFQSQVVTAAQPLLDQDVAAGTLTQAQEQRALKQLNKGIPNWTRAAGAGKPTPTPTPAT